jgi:hypothetical protein
VVYEGVCFLGMTPNGNVCLCGEAYAAVWYAI